jgi:hypothetical protein
MRNRSEGLIRKVEEDVDESDDHDSWVDGDLERSCGVFLLGVFLEKLRDYIKISARVFGNMAEILNERLPKRKLCRYLHVIPFGPRREINCRVSCRIWGSYSSGYEEFWYNAE